MSEEPSRRRVHARAHTDIAAPPAVVFSWLTEPDRVVRWVKDLVESRPLGESARLVAGARSIEVIKEGRELQEVPSQVTAVDPGRLIEIRMDTPGGPVTSRTEITPTSAGCAVTQSVDASLEGMRLIPSSILRALLAQRLNGDLGRLKKVVESG